MIFDMTKRAGGGSGVLGITQDANGYLVLSPTSGGGGSVERTNPYRPPDWPNLTSLTLTESGEYRDVFFTVDMNRTVDRKFKIYVVGGSGFCAIGHINNNAFVADATFTNTASTQTHDVEVPQSLGRFIVVRIYASAANQNGGESRLKNSSESALSGTIPVVEYYGKTHPTSTGKYQIYYPVYLCEMFTFDSGIASWNVNVPVWNNAVRYVKYKSTCTIGFTNVSSMFANKICLEKVEFPTYQTKIAGLTTTTSMFSGCVAIREIDLSMFSASAITTISSIFSSCYCLHTLNLAGWDLSSCTNVTNAFKNLYSLVEIDLTGSKFPNLSISFSESSLLSNASLVMIANALPVGSSTLTLNATPKATCSTIMGTVTDGVFTSDAQGTVSLASFITNTKGWTLA